MLNLFKGLFLRKGSNSDSIYKEIDKILDEIGELRDKIDRTDDWFNNEQDNDLIDACLYQRELLLARHRYLIKKLKQIHKANPPVNNQKHRGNHKI